MATATNYESPQPTLSADTDSLFIETKDVHDGVIKIKNTGGGILRGCVLSRCRGLTFTPSEFEGNSAEISYTFNAQTAGLGIGEALEAKFFITSNGGEKEIPVSAKLTKMSISTSDGHTIANIRDFYEYAQTHPTQARRLFTDSEFYMLLLAGGYEYMEVYESLHKDANRERAMDNFFILSGLKEKTQLSVIGDYGNSGTRLEFCQAPENRENIHGEFHIKKSDSGYIELPLVTEANWLTLSSAKLTSADFDETNTATVTFTIDPTKITNTFAQESIPLQGANAGDTIEIIYRRLPHLTLKLSRDSYRYTDRGSIEITNNTGKNLTLSIFCPDNFIRFAQPTFPISARAEIPFDVKLSTFMNAQMLFRKLPFMHTVIEIKTTIHGTEIKKTIPVVVGEW
ncbi:MAG: DUF5717 family protein [Defluviitaleaceae bacterium]|nr:DUF5717 family protein [Defluviitaleaceae bacterium]MCL2262536.1 DUF5717 family protein [Defluviitaleaceae bacterium]